MNYNPMQYSLARADVVGRTAENVEMSVINTVSNIDKMVQQKDAEKKLRIAYKEILNRFADEAMAADPSIDKTTAVLRGRRHYKLIESLPLADRIKMLISGEISAQNDLEKLAENVGARKKQTAVQGAIQQKGELGPEPEPGYYDLARTLGEEGQLEEYRQPVTREQGFQTASQAAPDLAYKEYEEMGGKSLPTAEDISKQQGRESMMEHRKVQEGQGQQRIDIMKEGLDLDRQKLALMKQKIFKDAEDMTFKDMDKILDDQRQWRTLQISNNGLVKTLNKAIDQITNKGQVDFGTYDELKNHNYQGAADMESLKAALKSANLSAIDIEITNDFLKAQMKRLRQGKSKTGAEAAMAVQKEIEAGEPLEERKKTLERDVKSLEMYKPLFEKKEDEFESWFEQVK